MAVDGGKGQPVGGHLRLFADAYRAAGYPELAQVLEERIPWRQDFISLAPGFFQNSPACSNYNNLMDAKLQNLMDVEPVAEIPLDCLLVDWVACDVGYDNQLNLSWVFYAR